MAIVRLLLVVLVVLCVAPRAHADESVPGEAGIEDVLRQGIALRRAGNDDAALALFLDLEKRAPDSVRVMLHIATAAQAAGKWTMAYDYMQKAASHRDDAYYQRHRAAIENVDKTISQRVGQFRARGAPVGAEVRLNGEVIGTLPMTNVKTVEVGSYVLEVYKAGYYPMRRPISITGGNLNQEAVELRERSALLASAGLGANASDPAPGADTGPTVPPTFWRSRALTWTLVGTAGAAAVTSGVAFVFRERDASKWNDDSQCLDHINVSTTRDQKCPGLHHDIKVAETVGVVAGVTALTLGAAAIVQVLTTSPRERSTESPSPQAHAGCSPGLGSVVCYGSF
jgi:hypothetical protein